MNTGKENHIVVVEHYEGFIEFLSDELEERRYFQGLGLPLEEIAEALDCKITVFSWDKWYRYELDKTWVPIPATRPVEKPYFGNLSRSLKSSRVKRVVLSARDPEHSFPLEVKDLNPRSYGLINDGGLLSFASYCLEKELRAFYHKDPFQAVILPMWGGLGYVSQMARATQANDALNVPFILVVTDTSANRQTVNQEGLWVRQAIIQRQMEDVSLALADLVLVFGPKGKEIATAGRLPEASAPIVVPRYVEAPLLDQIAKASVQSGDINKPLQFFLYEPQQPASGVLATLDAVNLLTNKGVKLERPVSSAGPSMIFAPMKPRTFEDYWSSRGAVQELLSERQWEWRRDYSHREEVFPVRLYPSFFEHLPNIWAELARGSLVVLSPAAAEGLAPGQTLPQEVLIQGDPVPENVADCLERIVDTDVERLDRIRREVCRRVVEAHRGKERQRLIDETLQALKKLLQAPSEPQNLSRMSLLFLDRCRPLRTLAQEDKSPSLREPKPGTKKGSLSVVVTCYEMGAMISETLESIWVSERQPDEVLLVDDGSYEAETLAKIKELQRTAQERHLPLKVIRQRNRGLAGARNAGLEQASGEFISFLDGDDIIEPSFYRIALQILQEYPHLGGVAAWATLFGTDIIDGFWNGPQAELPFLLVQNSVFVPCMTRTELLRDLGGYDIRQRYNYEDWELAIRMLAEGWPIVTVPRHLLEYRVRAESLLRTMTSVQNQVMRERLLNKHRETVAKFAVETAMQLENQFMRLSDPDEKINEGPVDYYLAARRKVLVLHKRVEGYAYYACTSLKELLRRARRIWSRYY